MGTRAEQVLVHCKMPSGSDSRCDMQIVQIVASSVTGASSLLRMRDGRELTIEFLPTRLAWRFSNAGRTNVRPVCNPAVDDR